MNTAAFGFDLPRSWIPASAGMTGRIMDLPRRGRIEQDRRIVRGCGGA
jgi:hypothetical protein